MKLGTLLDTYKGFRLYEDAIEGENVPPIIVHPDGRMIQGWGYCADVDTFRELIEDPDWKWK